MRIHFVTFIYDFKKQIEPLLLIKEACNNLMPGIINRLEQEGNANKN
ncbi:hypothetical protein GCM10007063_01690 [Lentibacillus kapialis]|uniref:Uncharacterized protein n=1 Tax=Lentibacillus kapialis TaxID=340214 RepID=A0A917PKL2_9BACI|nr:hypothetical protein [Lentibacillus kapialis]GGJ82867.1 hypothetical protein GCM10007063_01690 [Lentibacillus kapialis]